MAVDNNVDSHATSKSHRMHFHTVARYLNIGHGTGFERPKCRFRSSIFGADLDKHGDTDVASVSFFDHTLNQSAFL